MLFFICGVVFFVAYYCFRANYRIQTTSSRGIKELHLPTQLRYGWMIDRVAQLWWHAHKHLLDKKSKFWHHGPSFNREVLEILLIANETITFSYEVRGEVVGIASISMFNAPYVHGRISMLHMGSLDRALSEEDLRQFIRKIVRGFDCEVLIQLYDSNIPSDIFWSAGFVHSPSGWSWCQPTN